MVLRIFIAEHGIYLIVYRWGKWEWVVNVINLYFPQRIKFHGAEDKSWSKRKNPEYY